MRRRFSGRLIVAFRQAQAQGITNPKQLEKFIRGQIPDLPQGRAINKFVVNVLREFAKQERQFEKGIAGKSDAEQKLLRESFTRSLEDSEEKFAEIQKQQDKKFEDQLAKDQADLKQKNADRKKDEKDAREAEAQAKRDERDAKAKEKSDASDEEKRKAEAKAEESAKQAEKEAQDVKDDTQEIKDELKQKTAEASETDFNFGFPEEII